METIKCYSCPSQLVGLDYSVMLIKGNYYSFGITCRTFESIYSEVKDKLETLVSVDTVEFATFIEEIQNYFVKEFEG